MVTPPPPCPPPPGGPRILELLVILALVLVNGLLAGAEIAIVSVRTTRITELARSGSAAARAALLLRSDLETFLATVQVGITVVGAAAGAFGGAAFAGDLEPLLAAVPLLAPFAREIAFALVVVLLAYLSVVLGELVPKSLALRSSERFALLAARPLLLLSRAARPVVWFLSASSNAVLRVFGDRTTFTESRLSLEELRHLVREASGEGGIGERTGEILSRTLEFAELTAEDVMVPASHLDTVPGDATVAEVRRRFLESGRDRLPVSDPAADGLLGCVSWRDLESASSTDPGRPIAGLVRPAPFVPEVMAAVEVLRTMQAKRSPAAAVVDEHGGVVGVVFLQDLLEEIVGETLGEREGAQPSRIRVQADGTALVDGILSLRAANRALGTALEGEGRVRTVGGLCSVLAGGRIPAVGEELRAADGTGLVPVEVSARRVRVVRLVPFPRGGPAPEDSAP